MTFYFIDHSAGDRSAFADENSAGKPGDRVFNVFCNGKTILENLNVAQQAGGNQPLIRKIRELSPNAQGKLLLDFVPVTRYATVTAIEVVEE